MPASRQVSVSLEDEDREWLDAAAEQLDHTRSGYLRHLVRQARSDGQSRPEHAEPEPERRPA